MHFQKITAVVLREFIASKLEYSGVMDAVQCILLVVCGPQAEDDLAVKTVHWWLSNNPQII
jgi:hypothetical protein